MNPCVGCPDKRVDEYGYLCDLACGKRTMWSNYQAGIRAVIEELDLYYNQKTTLAELFIKDRWQAKLKEWGIE